MAPDDGAGTHHLFRRRTDAKIVAVARDVVAIAGCRRTADGDPTDLYPDPDAEPVQRALVEAGATSRFVSWDDPAVTWEEFSRIVVSSTWDSVDRPAEYLGWARRVAPTSVLINDLRLIEWNLDKHYLLDLEAAGVPVIPTTWVAPGEAWRPPQDVEFVVKPAISAGGRAAARYRGADERALAHVRALHNEGQTVMIQDYLASIDHLGEIDLVFFGGTFSHAVKKVPTLELGRGVLERPWEHMAWEGQVEPERRQVEVAQAVLEAVTAATGCQPVYGRVDLISSDSDQLVLELELIDPYLSLDTVPEAAQRLAAAALRR